MRVPALFSIAPCAIALLALAPAVGCASGHDFDRVVSAVEHRYATHAQRPPMMGFVNLCAWTASGGGVKGMHIAEFDHLTLDTSEDLSRLMRDKLGSEWQPFVTDRDANGQQDVIYVQPDGTSMRMFIADYNGDELDLVRLELNGQRLQKWLRNPGQSAHAHNWNRRNPD